LGVEGIAAVRQGKHFEVDVDGEVDETALGRVRELAEKLLANPVIEDFAVRVET
ncbi:MAG: phosphoribosylformylglycinamidine synthase subunit PurS, partial [Mycobacteriales bacterium]